MIAMNATAFKVWLSGAEIGDELVYHCGDLCADTDPAKGARARKLDDLLSAVLQEVYNGRVKLRQKPLQAMGACQHIARRVA